MRSTPRSLILGSAMICLALVLSGCGGSGSEADGSSSSGGSQDPLLLELKADGQSWDTVERYPDGTLKALGQLDAEGRPHGAWRWWYPEGGRWWEASYVAGSFNPAQPWTLYNPDGSARAASGDGVPPEEPPL